jgi:hypothetical protein
MDTGDVVVYEYQTPYSDEERMLDDRSLGAQDALKVNEGYADQEEPYAQVSKRQRRRRQLLLVALCLLLGIIALTSVLATSKNKSSREVVVGNGSGVDPVEGGDRRRGSGNRNASNRCSFCSCHGGGINGVSHPKSAHCFPDRLL